jgi:MoxR-like ATPase
MRSRNRIWARFCDGFGASLVLPARVVPVLTEDLEPSRGFIGRQQVIGRQNMALADCLAGQGQLGMLAGEPGIGKTRTALELARYAEIRGVRVF